MPLMIDSTDAKVIELALTYCQGKASSTRSTWRTARSVRAGGPAGAQVRRGAGGRLHRRDKQQGMAVTRERKLAIAERSLRAARPRSTACRRRTSIFDPAGLPVRHRRRAIHRRRRSRRSRAIRLIKQALPAVQDGPRHLQRLASACPPPGREVLNSVFLYHCDPGRPRPGDRQLGEARALRRRSPRRSASSPRSSCLTTAGDGSDRRVRRALPRAQGRQKERPHASLPLDERLARYIIEGTQGRPDRRPRAQALKEATPLDIINGPLMTGHGRGRPALQQQRADRRRSAADRRGDEGGGRSPRAVHGEGRDRHARARSSSPPSRATSTTSARTWSRSSSPTTASRSSTSASRCRPSELIAGDPASTSPDIVGLSGLLVKSAQQMVITAQDLTAAGIVPAHARRRRGAFQRVYPDARSRRPTAAGRLRQGRDERAGARANQIVDPERRARLVQKLQQEDQRLWAKPIAKGAGPPPPRGVRAGCPFWTRCRSPLTSTGMCSATSTWMKSGRTSTRRCCTPVTWDCGAAGPKNCWRETIPRPSSLRNSSTSSKRLPHGSDGGPRRVAVLSRVQ